MTCKTSISTSRNRNLFEKYPHNFFLLEIFNNLVRPRKFVIYLRKFTKFDNKLGVYKSHTKDIIKLYNLLFYSNLGVRGPPPPPAPLASGPHLSTSGKKFRPHMKVMQYKSKESPQPGGTAAVLPIPGGYIRGELQRKMDR